jgi:ribose transport system permease protein
MENVCVDNTQIVQQEPKKMGLLGKITSFRESSLLLIILAVCAIMSFASPYFLAWPNFKAILLSIATEGIVVVGMTILLVAGGFDLSVGSVMCLSMVIGGALFLNGVDPWLASVVAIACASLIGLTMGLIVTKIGLNFLITTLAFMGIARGLCFVITKGTPLSLFSLPKEFKFIGQGTLGAVPFSILIFAVIVIVGDYLMRNSTQLRKVFYTGSNEKAAIYSGINTSRVKIGTTIICSTLAGIAGIIYMSRFGAAPPGFGLGVELNVISAAIIGGASLTGGVGTVLGAILGITLLGIITNSMVLLNISPYWQDLVKGFILLAAVSVDHLSHAKKKK